MEKRKSYYVSRKNVLTWLSVLLILCSAVVRLVLRCEKGTETGSAMAFQIVLPIAAEVLLLLNILFVGDELLYRTGLPVALLCLSELCSLGGHNLWYRLLVWFLCVVYAVYYWETTAGRVRWTLDRVILSLLTLAVLLIRAVPEDYYYRGFRSADAWLCDLPALSCLLGLLCLTLAMRRRPEGEYHRTWGDRPDGRRLRSLDPVTVIGTYIMPNRNGANNLIRFTIDVTDTDAYIRKKRREGMPQLTITQIYLAAYCRVLAKYPGGNRFLSGQRIFSRGEDIVFNMIVKKEMTVEGEETSIKVHLSPWDTLETVSRKLDEAVCRARADDDSSFDQTTNLLKFLPGLLLKFAIWFLKVLDYFGLMPGWLLEISPFHGTVFFTSMASLGIPAIYHHLYDFGNLPVFCCLGAKYRRSVTRDDGTVEERKFMDVTFDCDERICDGFYYATALKHFRHIMSNPAQLELPPDEVRRDVD